MMEPESPPEGRAPPRRMLSVGVASVLLVGAGAMAYWATRPSPEAHFRNGERLLAQGDGKGAIIEFKNVLQAQPGNAEARFRLGQALYRQGDLGGAEKEFSRARAGGYPKAEVAPALARVLLVLGQSDRALAETAEIAGAPAAANARLWAVRSRIQLQSGDVGAARASLDRADQYLPGQPETLMGRAMVAFATSQPEAALGFVDQALAKAAGDDELWVLRGDILRSQGRAEDALAAYGRALASNAANLPGRLATAQLQVERGQLDAASASLAALRATAPSNLMGRYLEALVEQRRGRLQEARAKLQSVLASAPGFQAARLLAGLVDLGLGHGEEARNHLGKVLESTPDQPLARKLMALSLAQLGEAERAQAFLDALGEAGTDPMLLALGGQLALRRGEFAEAGKRLEKAASLAAGEPAIFLELAASRMGAGDARGAQEALRKAAELDTRTARPDTLLVLSLIRAKQYDQAMAVVDGLARERPRDPLVPNLRGSILAARDDRAGARAAFEAAFGLEPGYPPAGYNLARLDLLERNLTGARDRYQTILKHHPKETRAWIGLAHVAEQSGDQAENLKQLRQAKAADPKDPLPRRLLIQFWMVRKDYTQAQAEAREAVDAGAGDAFLEAVGQAQLARHDNAGALMSFAQWLKTSPDEPRSYMGLAQAQMAARDAASALATLDKLLARKPGLPEGQLLRAVVLAQSGRTEEALRQARDLQARQPAMAAAYATEADILFSQGRRPEAGRLYEKAARLSGRGEWLIRASQVLREAGKHQESEALLRDWLRGHPGNMPATQQLAHDLKEDGRGAEAESLLADLARRNPGNVAALNNLAWLQGELKRPAALATAEQAYRLAPDNPATLDTLGWIMVNAGQSRRGLELLEQALGKAPNMPEIRWHYAAGLAAAGDKTGAKRELDRLFSTGLAFPQEDEARKLLDRLH